MRASRGNNRRRGYCSHGSRNFGRTRRSCPAPLPACMRQAADPRRKSRHLGFLFRQLTSGTQIRTTGSSSGTNGTVTRFLIPETAAMEARPFFSTSGKTGRRARARPKDRGRRGLPNLSSGSDPSTPRDRAPVAARNRMWPGFGDSTLQQLALQRVAARVHREARTRRQSQLPRALPRQHHRAAAGQPPVQCPNGIQRRGEATRCAGRRIRRRGTECRGRQRIQAQQLQGLRPRSRNPRRRDWRARRAGCA